LTWLLDLLSCTQKILEAETQDQLKQIGQHIAADPVLNEQHKAMLRLIFGARWQQIKEQQTAE